MKKIKIGITVLLAILVVSEVGFADIGRIETKRERLLRESRESGQKPLTNDYLKIHENFLRENYAEVDRLSNDYLSHGLDKPNSQDVLYLQALSLLKLGRGSQARASFRELENSFTDTDRKASASASIGDSYYYEGNFDQAAEAYRETLSKYPNSDQTTYITYKLKEMSSKSGSASGSLNNLSAPYRGITAQPEPLKQNGIEEMPFYTVQVGSFSKSRNANALIHKLNNRHYDAFVEREPSNGLYRVRVGRFSSRADAAMIESRLKQEGYSTKIYP